MLLPSAAASEEVIEHFRREVLVASKINHPGIVKVHSAFFNQGAYCCVMEYIDGYSFGALLQRKPFLPLADVLIIAASVAYALKHAWDEHGLIHCDIKPDNIMVGSDGCVRLTDLGLCHARAFSRGDGYCSDDEGDEVLGTPAYMSPEQICGGVALDCRSDIYSLGATLYHLFTGRMLFTESDPEEIVRRQIDENAAAPNICSLKQDATVGFSVLLEKMLAKRTDCRHRNWDEVLADIALLESGKIPEPIATGAFSSMLPAKEGR